MQKLRWGILGTAKIGRMKVIPAMQHSKYCTIVAIASRDLERARSTAQRLGIPVACGSYEELLQDPQIDAVYIPLPNHLHVPWSIRSLEAGKHVLCEKPIGMTAADGNKLLEASRRHPGLKIMEAFMYRHHPQWIETLKLVREGRIGTLRTVHSFFSYNNMDADNIRNQAALGGGGLMDIGCYCISLSRLLYDRMPVRVSGLIDYDDRFKTDRLASGILDFSNGTATFTCSTQLTPYQRVHIFGSGGRIEIEIPFNAPPDRPTRIWLEQGGQVAELSFDICDQYTIQGDLFARSVLDDTPVPVPLGDAVANMRVIEALIESGRTEKWICL